MPPFHLVHNFIFPPARNPNVVVGVVVAALLKRECWLGRGWRRLRCYISLFSYTVLSRQIRKCARLSCGASTCVFMVVSCSRGVWWPVCVQTFFAKVLACNVFGCSLRALSCSGGHVCLGFGWYPGDGLHDSVVSAAWSNLGWAGLVS